MEQECLKLLPKGSSELRWRDVRVTVHNCTWFLCHLLQRLDLSKLSAVPIVKALNDAVCMLVEVACKSTDDVCIVCCRIFVIAASSSSSIFNNRMVLSVRQLRQPETPKRHDVWRRNFVCRSVCNSAGHGLVLLSIGFIIWKKIVLLKQRFGLCCLPQQHGWMVARPQ